MVWRRPLLILFILCVALRPTVLSVQMAAGNAYTLVDMQKDKRHLHGTTLSPVEFSSPQKNGTKEYIKRTGVIAKRPGAKATVLVCHGYMCNEKDVSLFRLIFPQYNVMTFNFRAHGEKVDESHCCTFGRDEKYDVMAAVKAIKADSDLKRLPLFVYAFSMGAVASILAQAEDPTLFKAMVLDCPYDRSENIVKRALNNTKINLFGYSFHIPCRSFLERYAFHPYVQSLLKAVLKTVANMDACAINTQIHPVNPEDSVKKITVPCYFIHCCNDEKVPVEAVKKVYDGAQGFKRLWITNGRRHFDSFFYNPEKYAFEVNKFFESVLNNKIAKKVPAKIKEDVVEEV